MPRTKKVKMAGRFGPRYGIRVRRSIVEIESQQRKKYVCKKCGKKAVKRVGTAIWECRSCGYKFAGGAYIPVSPAAKIVEQAVSKGKSL
ncbi:ribosomal protein L37a [Geoglobus ahangari]|uniref:Large ribosomal subunit protein eL43 n=1 Tax=Geoglobus ahangari TaxID=113653 RepID=A0A0F7IEP6_9EURY|nr:50S ribosomal protein L37Ae [Geoglobus ahangari]AKG92052.1 ribosomal protein L37a [Geoglobus ahangari]NOY11427.1 50S ribosomal protein L37Ae [Archaeoglobi archaeon]